MALVTDLNERERARFIDGLEEIVKYATAPVDALRTKDDQALLMAALQLAFQRTPSELVKAVSDAAVRVPNSPDGIDKP